MESKKNKEREKKKLRDHNEPQIGKRESGEKKQKKRQREKKEGKKYQNSSLDNP